MPARLPRFCRPLTPRPDGWWNAEAVTAGTIDGWPVPAASLLRLDLAGGLLCQEPPHDLEIAGILFQGRCAVTFVFRRPFRGTLAKDTVIDGVPCLGGAEIQLSGGPGAWWPLGGTLAIDAVVQGRPCQARTRFQRDGEGRLTWFFPSREVAIGGIPCAEGEQIRLQQGALWVATLAQPRTIDGVPCAAGGPVHFGAGHVRHARLADRWVASGAAYRAGTLISGELAQGRVDRGTLDEDATIDGLPCAAGAEIQRESARRELIELTLAADAVVDRFPCLAGTRIRRRGTRTYVLCRAHRLRGLDFDRGDRVVIDEYADYDRGDPFITVAGPRSLRGHVFPAGSVAQISGWLCPSLSVTLGAPAPIDGAERPAGTIVDLGHGARVKRLHGPYPAHPQHPFR